MPWDDKSGGGGPWGQGPSGGGTGGGRGNGSGGPGGGQGPDLEEILRRGQERFRQSFPGGGGQGGGLGFRGILVGIAVLIAIWLVSGFYRVQPDEQGVVLRFGAYQDTTNPGLNYHLPYPIETVYTPQVTRVNRVDVGMRTSEETRTVRQGTVRDVPEESLMLTGDENIIDIDFSVFWVINNAQDYLFNIQNPVGTVKAVAESSMREVVGQSNIQPLLTEGRQQAEARVQDLMQNLLDEYGAGIRITQVQIQDSNPPAAVIDAFRDVQAAEQERDRLERQADAYANTVLARARGTSAQLLEEAEAYRAQVVNQAQGEASRFSAVLEEYAKAPDVTRKRLYLETMEEVLGGIDKVIIDENTGDQGVVPYLPLNELRKGNN